MTKQRTLQLVVVISAMAILLPGYGAEAGLSSAPVIEGGRLGGLRYHVVAPGESLAAVAQRYGVSAEQIRAANGMSGSMLYAGARILLDAPNPGSPRPGDGQAAAASGASGQGTYTIRSGDSLYRIANRQGTTVDAITAANGISKTDVIMPGQQLVIPSATPAAPAAPPSQGTYTVRSGDSFYRIATQHDVSVAALVAANGLDVSTVIQPGETLTVPPKGSGGSNGTTLALTCPVPGGSYQYDWGFPREGGRHHQGIDMFAADGTPVRAPVSGQVTAGYDPTPGKHAVLRGNDGWQYYAAHLAGTGATGWVEAGEVIGYVGDSGNAAGTAPHLHLEMRPLDGRPTNPYPYIRTACGG